MSLEETIEAIVRRVVREEIASAVKPQAQYVTVAAYAAARSISVSTVRAAIREGRLPKKPIGRSVRVPASAEISPPDGQRDADERTSRADRALGILGVKL